MPAQTHLFLCLQDNFGVLIHDPATGATASIDAPEAPPVQHALDATGWKLTDILVTHHHGDHTAGIPELKKRHGAKVTAPRGEARRIADVDATVGEGDVVKLGSLSARVIETPGHTSGHITYWFEADKLAFVGDTLFSIGCGRVIEGTPEMMWNSLMKLRALPDDTRIFCGHEYTAANIRFATTIEPGNAALEARAEEAKQQIAAGKPTIPTTIGEEKQANPFLRADIPAVAAAVGLAGKPPAQVFAEIREREEPLLSAVLGSGAFGSAALGSAGLSAADVIRLLGLAPHPEGGHFRETFRDTVQAGGRAASTAIYFLLARGERSHWHRVDAAEGWHWHAGAALRLEIAHAGAVSSVRLGPDLIAGERPQAIVPAHAWQAAESLGDWTLVGCTVAPGFEFAGFEMAPAGWSPG